jgi:excisionase family DNA binding protein
MRLSDVGSLPPTLSTEQAAELLGVGVDHLWRLARDGEAPVTPLRLGHRLRWPTSSLLRLLGMDGPPEPGDPMAVPPRDDAEASDASASITTLRRTAGRGLPAG